MYIGKNPYLCKVKRISGHNGVRTIAANMAWLSGMQVVNYLIPVVLIPFVTRALGTEAFGKVCYAQNIVSYLTLLVNFGFDYAATRDIATRRQDKQAVNDIFRTVMQTKALLLGLSLLATAGICLWYAPAQGEAQLYIWASLLNIGFALFPTWLYQGMEEMGRLSLMNMMAKAVGAVLIICLVRTAGDYVLYAAILTLCNIGIACIAFMDALRHYSIRIRDGRFDRAVVRHAASVAVTLLAGALYGAFGLTIAGWYIDADGLGIYAGSQKIIQACIICLCFPLTTALFPRMSSIYAQSRSQYRRYMVWLIAGCVAAGLVGGALLWLAADAIVQLLLGSAFAPAAAQVRAMAWLPLCVLLCTTVTVQGLYGMQRAERTPLIAIAAGATSVAVNCLLVPEMLAYGCITAWYAAQIAELTLTGSVILYLLYRQTKTQ